MQKIKLCVITILLLISSCSSENKIHSENITVNHVVFELIKVEGGAFRMGLGYNGYGGGIKVSVKG